MDRRGLVFDRCDGYRHLCLLERSSHMKRIVSYIVINVALLSLAFGQSVIQREPADSSSEQEVRQVIEKYRVALLRRDIPALEQICADTSKHSGAQQLTSDDRKFRTIGKIDNRIFLEQ